MATPMKTTLQTLIILNKMTMLNREEVSKVRDTRRNNRTLNSFTKGKVNRIT